MKQECYPFNCDLFVKNVPVPGNGNWAQLCHVVDFLTCVCAGASCHLLGNMQWFGSYGSECSNSATTAGLYSGQKVFPCISCGCVHPRFN